MQSFRSGFILFGALAALTVVWAVPAQAQPSGGIVGSDKKDQPRPCLKGSSNTLDRGCSDNGKGHPTLSDKLSQSEGTIKPPPVDSGIVAPTPNPGPQSTPVIPAPGTPGGNPNVVPK